MENSIQTSYPEGLTQRQQHARVSKKQVLAKRMFLQFLSISLTLAVTVALFTIIIDPLQFYHRGIGYTPLLSWEERYQNPGLTKNYDYDTIIIGTSMTENFIPSEVNAALGGTTMKLSMEGSRANEHYKMAKLALETGKVKKVLWGIDYFSLKNQTKDDAAKFFPDYMYDNNLWNDYKYWFNYSVYQQFFRSLKANMNGKVTQNIEYLNNWNSQVKFGKDRTAASYAKANKEETYFEMSEESIDVVQANFKEYILSLVQAYPDVEFYFFYPPYSVLRQVVWYNTNPTRFNNQIMMKTWMFEQFAAYDNVKLYDFQTEREWIYDLDLYKDLSHHHQQVNSWIAQAVGRDDAQYRVTSANVQQFNQVMIYDAKTAVLNEANEVENVAVRLEGELTPFTHRKLMNGELFVPVKEAVKVLGSEMTWDQTAKVLTLKRDQHIFAATVGDLGAIADGQHVQLKAAPHLNEGMLFIPIRETATYLGWIAEQCKDGQVTEIDLYLNPH